MKTFYMAHPFSSRFVIREIQVMLEVYGNIKIGNPFYDSDHNRQDVADIDAGRTDRYEKLDPDTLVTNDLSMINKRDGIIATVCNEDFCTNNIFKKLWYKLIKKPVVSYGTLMEIVYAHQMKKIIYIVVLNGHEEHPWLKYHATKIFTSFEYLANHLAEERLRCYGRKEK